MNSIDLPISVGNGRSIMVYGSICGCRILPILPPIQLGYVILSQSGSFSICGRSYDPDPDFNNLGYGSICGCPIAQNFTPNQSQMIALGLAWEQTNCLIIRAHDGMIISCFLCLVRILSELSNLVQSAKRSKRILGYGH